MMSASGFDLSPLLRIALMGIAVAFGPLAWVWLRNQQSSPARRLRALTVLTLFLTFDLVLFGAFTRLTDSGLGCPDWPGCYGHASPVGADAHIEAAQLAMPTGPVTQRKAWIEMLHRYMATGVGVLIITLVVVRWQERRRSLARQAEQLPGMAWPLATLVAVCAQGAFGALTVTMKLFPAIVTLHLLGGLLLLALLVVQASQLDASLRKMTSATLSPRLYTALCAVCLLLVLQIALGGWVSTNYAVLACQSFPACQGSWWPAMDFQQGFTVWRDLGMTGDGANLSFAALTAVHYVHRLMAYLVLLALGMLAWQLLQIECLKLQGRALALLTALQGLTGLSNVVLDWPLVAALAHTGGAAALLGVLVWTFTVCQPPLARSSTTRPNAARLTA